MHNSPHWSASEETSPDQRQRCTCQMVEQHMRHAMFSHGREHIRRSGSVTERYQRNLGEFLNRLLIRAGQEDHDRQSPRCKSHKIFGKPSYTSLNWRVFVYNYAQHFHIMTWPVIVPSGVTHDAHDLRTDLKSPSIPTCNSASEARTYSDASKTSVYACLIPLLHNTLAISPIRPPNVTWCRYLFGHGPKMPTSGNGL